MNIINLILNARGFRKSWELLIDAAVADCQVTDKEIEILARRAQAEGVDIEMSC